MLLSHLLFTQGFGTRRACKALLSTGRISIGNVAVHDDRDVSAPGFTWTMDGVDWSYRAQVLVLMHKPVGYECSTRPSHHPSVLSLLPGPLQVRRVQPVGRLDVDTTGVLMLTDDGALLHRLTSPRHHVDKVYDVTTVHSVTPEQVQRLLDGVVLDDHPQPVRALVCSQSGDRALSLTVDQGRYHQVKRMLAAVGNRVIGLHRSAFGPWTLPNELKAGEWRWVDAV